MYRFTSCLIFLLVFTSASLAQKRTASNTSKSKPFVLGHIQELFSKELGENRILNIYLPEDYGKADTIIYYPVIYLLDGSADEDFIHVTGLVQFNTFPWVNKMPKSIVVGIANVDRRRDYSFPTTVAEHKKSNPTSGHSDRFIAFLEKELQPYINRTYTTNGTRTIIGESLGGLLATEILLKRPALFNKYVIVSPSLWWNNGSLLQQSSSIMEASYTQPTEVYIAVGKEGLTPGPAPRVMEVDANLLADKLRQSKSAHLQVYFDYLPQENHATIGHQAVFNGLRWVNKVP